MAESTPLREEGEDDRFLLERVRLERRQIVERYDLGRDGEGAKTIDDWEDPKFEIYHAQDRYGFIHDKRLPDKGRSERENKQIRQEVARTLKWAEMIKDEKKYFDVRAKNREKMINRVYKGVPDSVRGKVWYILLEIDKIKKIEVGKYKKLLMDARANSPDIRQIDLDVNRTYRDHAMFRERYNLRQQALFHVLAAYSMYNTEVGYCQGMSQIAALLLMYLNEEEDVFWALHQLMVGPRYAMHGFFIQGFPKLLRFQGHHDKIMKKFLPKLKKHMDKNGIDTGIYTLKWFFQCFLDRLPFSLTLRVWDLYLLEGERVMIGMAYNILRMHRRYLMKQGMDELIEHLQINLEKDFGYDDDTTIDKLREVISELASNRLDSPGRPPPEELPTRPFWPSEMRQQQLTLEQEIGFRTGLSEKERVLAQNTLQRTEETENRIKLLNEQEEEDEDSDIADTSSSLAEAAASFSSTPIPRRNRDHGDNNSSRITSSTIDLSTTLPHFAHHPPTTSISTSASHHHPQTDITAIELMLETTKLNGDDDNVDNGGRCQQHHQRYNSSGSRYASSLSSKVVTKGLAAKSSSSRQNGVVTSYEERSSRKRKTEKLSQSLSEQKMVITKSDVVRIHVPYTPEVANEEVTVVASEKNKITELSQNKRFSAPR